MKKLLIISVLLSGWFSAWSQDIAAGEKMFNSSCKACHSIGKGKIVGPDLKNVQERRKEAWLIKFIKTPGAVINSGDKEAVKLFEENNKILMPDHTFLSDQDIKNVLAYITKESGGEVKESSKKEKQVKKEEKKTEVMTASSVDVKEGEEMFNANCKACHSIGKGKIVGPDLKNVSERRKEEWLLKFIKKPEDMIKAGDPDAKKLFEEHNQVLMPDHGFLTDANIKNILGYISEQSKEEVEVKKAETKDSKEELIKKNTLEEQQSAPQPLTAMDYFLYILIGFCAILVLITVYLIVQVRRVINAEKGA